MILLILALDTLSIDDRVFEIAEKLRCLVCAGETVAYSQSDLARDMRLKIKELLLQGKTEEEILDYFVSIYGEDVLAEPPKKGFFNLIWLIPSAVFILSALGILIYQFSLKKENIDEEVLKKLEENMEEEDEKNDNPD